MDPITKIASRFSKGARERRAALFGRSFAVNKTTRILDIGSEDGTNIFNVLKGSDYTPANVCIADVTASIVGKGRSKYGFNAVVLDEQGPLPFENASFDIVYCSSVIEHVTTKIGDIWRYTSGNEFRMVAFEHQKHFADEIRRVGRQYFVQTPSAGFPIESHTWLPLAGYLPRKALLPTIKLANRFWPKASQPDFNLLNEKEFRVLFPDAEIVKERVLGITKSLMAIKSDLSQNDAFPPDVEDNG